MEHRWGERIGVDIPVRITAHPFSVRHGRLTNLSVSGASIKTEADMRVLSRIALVIEIPHTMRSEAPTVAAYVTRSNKGTFGVEWCEFAPPVISDLLATLSARPDVRLRKPETAAAIAISRLSAPLLQHGAKELA